jgi:hypothetical protein
MHANLSRYTSQEHQNKVGCVQWNGTGQDAYSAPLWLEIPSAILVIFGQIDIQLTGQKTRVFWRSTQNLCFSAVCAFRRWHVAQGRLGAGLPN